MRAAVYRGPGTVVVEDLPEPEPGPGELVVRVEACGVCPTDLKKIKEGLLPPPRVYGHETAGRVESAGAGVVAFKPGDRVALYHHVGCGSCPACLRGEDAHCPQYKRVGVTAGFEPAGGGYAERVRVSPWIVAGGGVAPVPAGVSPEEAAFLEPVNTCLKAVDRAGVGAGTRVLILGTGPVGLLMLQICRDRGAEVLAWDPRPDRREAAVRFGCAGIREPGAGPGTLDTALVCAASAPAVSDGLASVRPGGRVVLFANTKDGDRVPLDAGDICRNDKILMGSYSSSRAVHARAAGLVFGGKLRLGELVTHRFALAEAPRALALAMEPPEGCLKVMVLP